MREDIFREVIAISIELILIEVFSLFLSVSQVFKAENKAKFHVPLQTNSVVPILKLLAFSPFLSI